MRGLNCKTIWQVAIRERVYQKLEAFFNRFFGVADE